MIHYSKGYNCAHFVSDYYAGLGIVIPVVNEFDTSFIVWMRRHFTRIDRPEEHALVLMVTDAGLYHVGVFHDWKVWHNYKPPVGSGSVIACELSAILRNYTKVSYWRWSE